MKTNRYGLIHRSRHSKPLFRGATALCLLQLLGAGCINAIEAPLIGDAGGDTIILADNLSTIGNVPPPEGTVCDPFANNPNYPGSQYNMGIVGNLNYLTADQPRYGSAADYSAHGHNAGVTLFLDQLNIPTRRFDLGFQTQSGQVIQTIDGNTLYEYFGLDLQAELKLGANDAPGPYQLAILSDDGAVLDVTVSGNTLRIVDNDGVHPTRMGCATTPLQMSAGQTVPMHLQYYQGPRYHIALLLMWRPWPASGSVDSYCGQSGNSLFFDYNTVPSTPQAAYQNLLTHGWKVLSSDNYALPKSVASNPCTQPNIATYITKFTPQGSYSTQADVTFDFNSNITGSTFQCSLDGAVFSPCTSPQTYLSLQDGAHSFTVQAISPQGQVDTVGATHNWVIDRVPPMLTFISISNSTSSITIQWNTSEAASSLVNWGPDTLMSNLIPDDGVFVTSHQQILSGLQSRTTYFFQVGGSDPAGNSFLSSRFAGSTR